MIAVGVALAACGCVQGAAAGAGLVASTLARGLPGGQVGWVARARLLRFDLGFGLRGFRLHRVHPMSGCKRRRVNMVSLPNLNHACKPRVRPGSLVRTSVCQ